MWDKSYEINKINVQTRVLKVGDFVLEMFKIYSGFIYRFEFRFYSRCVARHLTHYMKRIFNFQMYKILDQDLQSSKACSTSIFISLQFNISEVDDAVDPIVEGCDSCVDVREALRARNTPGNYADKDVVNPHLKYNNLKLWRFSSEIITYQRSTGISHTLQD